MAKKGKYRVLAQLAQELQEKHAALNSWPKASIACDVLTEDGRPDPGLAHRIATKGYDPRRNETRQRLGLPPICVTCHTRIKRVHHVPAWLDEAVANLRKLEEQANPAPEKERVYGRGGKRAITGNL
jgi:hypothetical protein